MGLIYVYDWVTVLVGIGLSLYKTGVWYRQTWVYHCIQGRHGSTAI